MVVVSGTDSSLHMLPDVHVGKWDWKCIELNNTHSRKDKTKWPQANNRIFNGPLEKGTP